MQSCVPGGEGVNGEGRGGWAGGQLVVDILLSMCVRVFVAVPVSVRDCATAKCEKSLTELPPGSVCVLPRLEIKHHHMLPWLMQFHGTKQFDTARVSLPRE